MVTTYSDDFSSFDTNKWTVRKSSTYQDSNNRVLLDGSSDNDEGELEFDTGTSNDVLDIESDILFDGGSAAVKISFFADAIQSSNTNPKNGYLALYQHYQDKIKLYRFSGGSGTKIADESYSISDAGHVHGCRVHVAGDVIRVYIDGDLVLQNAVDGGIDRTHSGIFFTSRSGGVKGAHAVHNFNLRDGTSKTFKTDNFDSFDTSRWSLLGSASYNSTDNDVDLIPSVSSSGALELDSGKKSGEDWDQSASLYISNNSAFARTVWFAKGVNKSNYPDKGYSIEWEAHNDQVKFREYTSSGSWTDHKVVSHAFGGDCELRVDYNAGGDVKAYVDGTKVIDYSISNPTEYGTRMWWSASHGGSTPTVTLDAWLERTPAVLPPANLSAAYQPDTDTVLVSWDDQATSEDGYRVRDLDTDTELADLAANSTSFETSTTFNPGDHFKHFRVTSYNSNGKSDVSDRAIIGEIGVTNDFGGSVDEATDNIPSDAETGSGSHIILGFGGIQTTNELTDDTRQSRPAASTGKENSFKKIPDGKTQPIQIEKGWSQTTDTTTDFPIRIKQDFEIGNLKLLSLERSMVTAQMKHQGCSVSSRISSVSLGGGTASITVTLQINCPDSAAGQTIEGKTGLKLAPKGTPMEAETAASTQAVTPEAFGVNGVGSGFASDSVPFTTATIYGQFMGVGRACAPLDNGTVTVPVTYYSRHTTDGFNLEISYNPNVVSFNSVSASGSWGASITSTVNSEDGIITLSSSRTSGFYANGFAKTGFVTFDLVGNTGDETTLEIIDDDSSINGAKPDFFGRGRVEINNEINVGSTRLAPDSTESVPVSVNATSKVKEFAVDIGVSDADLLTDISATSTHTITQTVTRNGNGSATITVEGVMDSATEDPTLFDLVLSSKKAEDLPTMRFLSALTVESVNLLDANDNTITTECIHGGRFVMSVPTHTAASSATNGKIPETGVVYWPIKIPLSFEFSNVNTSALQDITADASSSTNPDIHAETYNYREDPATSTAFVDVMVTIPQADNQSYPVDYNLEFFPEFAYSEGLNVSGDIESGVLNQKGLGGSFGRGRVFGGGMGM